MKKIASRKAKPALEKGGRDHNLIGIWRRDSSLADHH
jgi:hypothetical protein